jgi:hypothetical protein
MAKILKHWFDKSLSEQMAVGTNGNAVSKPPWERKMVEQRKRGRPSSGPSSRGVTLNEIEMPVDTDRFLEERTCVAEAVWGLNASMEFGAGKPQNLGVARLNFSTLASVPLSTVTLL